MRDDTKEMLELQQQAKDLVLILHQSPWSVRTYNGGRWQVYGPGLLHVADFGKDQRDEAERLCDIHNKALELLNSPKPKPKLGIDENLETYYDVLADRRGNTE